MAAVVFDFLVKIKIRTFPEETKMCLGDSQANKLNLRIKYLQLEVELRNKIICHMKLPRRPFLQDVDISIVKLTTGVTNLYLSLN